MEENNVHHLDWKYLCWAKNFVSRLEKGIDLISKGQKMNRFILKKQLRELIYLCYDRVFAEYLDAMYNIYYEIVQMSKNKNYDITELKKRTRQFQDMIENVNIPAEEYNRLSDDDLKNIRKYLSYFDISSEKIDFGNAKKLVDCMLQGKGQEEIEKNLYLNFLEQEIYSNFGGARFDKIRIYFSETITEKDKRKIKEKTNEWKQILQMGGILE